MDDGFKQDTVDCEILHHQKDGGNPINNWINYLSTGAGFRNHPQCHKANSLDMSSHDIDQP